MIYTVPALRYSAHCTTAAQVQNFVRESMTFCPPAVAPCQHLSSVGLTRALTLPCAPPLLPSAPLAPGHFISSAPNYPPIATAPSPSLKSVYNPYTKKWQDGCYEQFVLPMQLDSLVDSVVIA